MLFQFNFSLCLIEYDFILKYESLEKEQRFMLEILELQSKIRLEVINRNAKSLNLQEKKKYFQMLNQTEFDDLKNFYLNDFLLFDYDPSSFT